MDRGDLRDLLLNSLPDGTIHWGRMATGARALGDGRHEVSFSDGSAITTDLLIGADGAWSRVRPLVSDARPAYTGISFVETDLFEADTRHPRSAAVVGGGFFICLGDERGFLAHRESDGSLHVYTALKVDEAGWTRSTSLTTPPPKPRSSPASRAGTRGCAVWWQMRRRWLRAASTPCRWATAGTASRV